MSRLDHEYLSERGLATWKQAYAEASHVIGCPWTSIKQLRDEFDPLFPNSRLGWHKREVRPEIRRTYAEMMGVNPEQHMELACTVLMNRVEDLGALPSMLDPVESPTALADRLRTGRLAEEWFYSIGYKYANREWNGLADRRYDAVGFDFNPLDIPSLAIEVKGISGSSGGILFTDKEKSVSHELRENYLLAVVTSVAERPKLHVIPDPGNRLSLKPNVRLIQAHTWQVNLGKELLMEHVVSN